MRKSIYPCIVLAVMFSHASAQTALLKNKLASQLHSIADTSNCIVGIAMKDLTTGEKFLINENEIFPQASAIKIHILAELYRQAAEKKFSLADVVPLSQAFKVGGSGILNSLDNNVSMTLRDYAVLMIVLSDNSATNLLIDKVGMDNVNASLEKIGATHTKLQRVMMDYKAAAEGKENISTPADVMLVLENMYNGDLVNKASCDDMLSVMRIDKDTPMREGVPSTIQIADKSGDIEGVRCDVGIVYVPGHPFILCVMTKLLQEDSEGGEIITAVSRLAFDYFERIADSNEYGRRIPR
ncbi:MAG: serine hydrolase [Bacteroidota bacterium]|nr:serine hydrolase [Bacteroidota bacterium]